MSRMTAVQAVPAWNLVDDREPDLGLFPPGHTILIVHESVHVIER